MSNPMDISKGRIQGRQQLQKFKEVTDRLKVGLTALWDLSHRLWTWTLILSPCHQGHCHVVQIHTNIWCVRAAVHYLLLLCCVSATAVPLWVIVSNGLTGRVHWGGLVDTKVASWVDDHRAGSVHWDWHCGRMSTTSSSLPRLLCNVFLIISVFSTVSAIAIEPKEAALEGEIFVRFLLPCLMPHSNISNNTFSVMSPFLALASPPAASVNPFERMASLFQDIQKLNGHDQGTHILCVDATLFTFILCLFWDNNSISWYYTSVITLKT